MKWILVLLVTLLLVAAMVAFRAMAPQPELRVRSLEHPTLVLQEVFFERDVTLFAKVCKPKGSGPFPTVLVAHGGFVGPNASTLELCQSWAKLGYLVAIPHMRGQGQSQGQIGVCQEEGPDLRYLAERLPQLGGQSRHSYVGISLGACTALSAARNDANALGVVFVMGPSDFKAMMTRLQSTGRSEAVERWEGYIGAALADCPSCYAQRSPLRWAAEIKAPILMLSAGNDPLVSVQQFCDLIKVRQQAGYKVAKSALTPEGQIWQQPLQGERFCLGDYGPIAPPKHDQMVLFPNLDHQTTPYIWKLITDTLNYWRQNQP